MRYLDEYRDLCKIEVPADADAATKQKLADEQLRREANYLSLVGRGREGQGRLVDALTAYEQFGALTGNKELVAKTLSHWQKDGELASIRDEKELAKLPEAERAEWKSFWSDVEALRKWVESR